MATRRLLSPAQALRLGAIFLTVAAVALFFGAREAIAGISIDAYRWQVWTGTGLLITFLYQLMLFVARERKDREGYRQLYALHPAAGVLAILLFATHANAFGYGLTSLLAILFLANSAFGVARLLAQERGRQKLSTALRLTHIAASAAMIPPVLVHVWSALFFN